MVKDIINNQKLLDFEISFEKIQEYERMEERFFEVEKNYGDILGMNIDSIEFCPNYDPPLIMEILPWLWVSHPELKEEIIELADDLLKTIIKDYDEADNE